MVNTQPDRSQLLIRERLQNTRPLVNTKLLAPADPQWPKKIYAIKLMELLVPQCFKLAILWPGILQSSPQIRARALRVTVYFVLF